MIIYREASTLSQDLGIPVKTLYAVSNHVERHYRTVEIPKGDASFRRLSIPDEILKKIQRSITDRLLVHMPISPYAAAYRFGGSILRNAVPHRGKQQLLNLDICHFFDHILYSAVKDAAFPSDIYAEPLRILLTMLCYYREALPQGAPSSPVISNIIMKQFDEIVGEWCREKSISYSRYCDDMSFSGQFDKEELLAFVRRELRAKGFFLNERKTKEAKAGQRQRVTGLTVNEKVNVPADYRKKLRQELYYSKKCGIEAHLSARGICTEPDKYVSHLLGQVNYVLQYSPENEELQSYRQWLIGRLRVNGIEK